MNSFDEQIRWSVVGASIDAAKGAWSVLHIVFTEVVPIMYILIFLETHFLSWWLTFTYDFCILSYRIVLFVLTWFLNEIRERQLPFLWRRQIPLYFFLLLPALFLISPSPSLILLSLSRTPFYTRKNNNAMQNSFLIGDATRRDEHNWLQRPRNCRCYRATVAIVAAAAAVSLLIVIAKKKLSWPKETVRLLRLGSVLAKGNWETIFCRHIGLSSTTVT